MINVLNRADLRELAVVGRGLEILDWTLYDSLVIATGGTQTSFKYFQQAVGPSGVTLQTTNMEIPGQLPAGYKFVPQRIVFTPKQALTLTAADVKDIVAVSHRGSAQLFIGNRPYLQVDLQDLIGGCLIGFAGAFDAATSLAYAAPRARLDGTLEYSPVIPANFSFSMVVTYDAAPTLVKNTTLVAKLVGKMIRPQQG